MKLFIGVSTRPTVKVSLQIPSGGRLIYLSLTFPYTFCCSVQLDPAPSIYNHNIITSDCGSCVSQLYTRTRSSEEDESATDNYCQSSPRACLPWERSV